MKMKAKGLNGEWVEFDYTSERLIHKIREGITIIEYPDDSQIEVISYTIQKSY
jgi:hypothetical protein